MLMGRLPCVKKIQAHPNAFFLPPDIQGSISLAQLRNQFPLVGQFHFRYRVSPSSQLNFVQGV